MISRLFPGTWLRSLPLDRDQRRPPSAIFRLDHVDAIARPSGRSGCPAEVRPLVRTVRPVPTAAGIGALARGPAMQLSTAHTCASGEAPATGSAPATDEQPLERATRGGDPGQTGTAQRHGGAGVNATHHLRRSTHRASILPCESLRGRKTQPDRHSRSSDSQAQRHGRLTDPSPEMPREDCEGRI